MSGDTRYFVAVGAAQQILELPACLNPDDRPRRLAKLAYLILDAMEEAERQLSHQIPDSLNDNGDGE